MAPNLSSERGVATGGGGELAWFDPQNLQYCKINHFNVNHIYNIGLAYLSFVQAEIGLVMLDQAGDLRKDELNAFDSIGLMHSWVYLSVVTIPR